MSLTVTAAQSGTGGTADGIALTVKALTGQAASPIGNTGSSTTITTPELAITPTGTGSWVYGAVVNVGADSTFTAAGTTTFSQNVGDTTNGVAYGTFRSTSTTTASTPVTLGATAPTESAGNLIIALLEILKGTGLAEDSSSPAVATTKTTDTVTTASFSPPAGSLLVAVVASNASGTTNDSMTMTVSDSSGLTWTRRVTGSLVEGTGSYQLATVWTAPVPGGTSVALTAPGVTLAAPLLAPSAGGAVALTAPNAVLAAPAVTPGGGATVALTAPNAALAAPLVTPVTGKTVALTAPGIALGAPLMALSAGATVALTALNAAFAAPAVALPAVLLPSFPDPAVQLDVRLELNAGGTWADVTSDCDHGPWKIGRGHPDESTTVSPSTFDAQLTNGAARYSPDNPMSDLWPWCVQNMPGRASIPASQNYLRLEFDTGTDGAQVADTTALHITGSIEMRTALRLTNWTGAVLAARRDGTTGSWHWLLNGDGTVQFGWWDSGGTFWSVNSSAALPFLSSAMALRVTLNASTAQVTFYYASGSSLDPSGWTQLGITQTASGLSSTSVRAGNCPLIVGYSSTLAEWTDGSVYGFRLYNGIGGTVVADAGFSSQAAGATSWTDAYGLAWSLSGDAEISDRRYRAHFESSEWPQEEPEYNPDAENDGSVEVDALVPLVGGGLLRRYGQRAPVVESPMKRSLLAASGSLECVALWPCEPDTSSTSRLSSAIPGAAPITYFSGTPTVADSSPFGGATQALPVINGSHWDAPVPPYVSNGSIVVRLLIDFSDSPPTGTYWFLTQVNTTGTAAFLEIVVYDPSDYSSTGPVLGLWGFESDGSTTVFNSGAVTGWDTGLSATNTAFWVSIEVQEVSGQVQYSLVVLGAGETEGQAWTSSLVTGSVGNATGIVVNPDTVAFDSTALGMISVQSAWESLYNFSPQLNAYTGEPAGQRFARLCGENGIPCRIRGNAADTVPMGAQASDTLANLVQACATADMGVWQECRQVLGWGYVTRKALYNQPATATASYLSDHLSMWTTPPTRDDQVVVNDVTVVNDISGAPDTSTGTGASVRVYAAPGQPIPGGRMSTLPPAQGGIGSYAQSYQIQLAADDLIADEAGWLLHVGTVDQARLPGIMIDLANEDAAAILDDVLDLDLGGRLVITSPPRRLGFNPVTQLADALTETLWYDTLTIGIAGVPEMPYEVVAAGSGMHLAPSAGVVSSAESTTSTSWSVAASSTDSTQLWSVNAADYPQNWMTDGEEVTVTAMSGSSSPQTATVTRSVNGVVKSHLSGAAVTTWPPPVIGL